MTAIAMAHLKKERWQSNCRLEALRSSISKDGDDVDVDTTEDDVEAEQLSSPLVLAVRCAFIRTRVVNADDDKTDNGDDKVLRRFPCRCWLLILVELSEEYWDSSSDSDVSSSCPVVVVGLVAMPCNNVLCSSSNTSNRDCNCSINSATLSKVDCLSGLTIVFDATFFFFLLEADLLVVGLSLSSSLSSLSMSSPLLLLSDR